MLIFVLLYHGLYNHTSTSKYMFVFQPLLSMPTRENTRPVIRDPYTPEAEEEQYEEEEYEGEWEERGRGGGRLRPPSRSSVMSRPGSGSSRPRSRLVDTQVNVKAILL